MAKRSVRKPLSGVAAKSFEYEAGTTTGWHTHDHSQLVYAVIGTMTVLTDMGLWVVPSFRAVWIPQGVRHNVQMNTNVSMRTAYFDNAHSSPAHADCFVVPVAALLRELLVAATAPPQDAERKLLIHSLLLKELESVEVLPLHLPQPNDPLLRRATDRLIGEPTIKFTQREASKIAGSSERNFARRFKSDTGLTFGQWRQQAILVRALQRLASDDSITAIAFGLGYDSASAFTHMFRNALGTTPGKYFSEN